MADSVVAVSEAGVRFNRRPVTLDQLIALSPSTPALQDDRPINEYFLLRTPFDQLMNMENEAQTADVPAAAAADASHSQ